MFQAGYRGVCDYYAARAAWFMVEAGMPERLARRAANDGTPLGPRWVRGGS